ncbi:MAG: hypothetical protein KC592_17220 [Nitrospira sp.]|nr:hypothetical protein [Nitrospira sp.]
MCRKILFSPYCVLLAFLFTVLSACNKVSIPRLGFESEPEPRLPLNISYAFSDSLLQYTQTVDACGLPYSIPVGDLIAKTFMKVGMERFNTVQAEPPVGQASGTPPDGYRILLNLNQFTLDPVTKTGEEERYHAFVDLNMQAVYEDSQGTALAQSPLLYHQKVSLWTPALSGQSASCSTTQLDGTVENAAEALARDMISVLPRLNQSIAAETPPAPVSPPTSDQPGIPPGQPFSNTNQAVRSIQAEVSPSIQFRTKLVDANRNLVLEGGEAVILLIESTNVSEKPIPSAYVELRGTQALVEAFKRGTSLPVPLGSFSAGEKRTAEIRGRLGQVTEHIQGELIIGIILSEGLPPGTHTIRAEIQPGPKRKQPSR